MPEAMSVFCDRAAQEGLTVTIEDFDDAASPISTMEGMKWFTDRLPLLRVALDTGNFFYSGEDVLQALELFADRIVHVHCKDRLTGEQGPYPGVGALAAGKRTVTESKKSALAATILGPLSGRAAPIGTARPVFYRFCRCISFRIRSILRISSGVLCFLMAATMACASSGEKEICSVLPRWASAIRKGSSSF